MLNNNQSHQHCTLVADIGGTNARFALAIQGELLLLEILPTDQYRQFTHALHKYLDIIQPQLQQLGVKIDHALIAVAGPVVDTIATLTNKDWTIDSQVVSALLQCPARIINDFVAQAMTLARPNLKLSSIYSPAQAINHQHSGTKLILGPGTGLGVAYSIHGQIQSTEAGHITLCSTTALEFDIFQYIQKRHQHACAEHVCSGAGLELLYCFFSGQQKTAKLISRIGKAQPQSYENQAIQQFLRYFGHIAGQIALTVNAQAGVYLSGGLSQHLAELFIDSDFIKSFLEKGRFTPYLEKMPVWLINEEQPALAGLAYEAKLIDNSKRLS